MTARTRAVVAVAAVLVAAAVTVALVGTGAFPMAGFCVADVTHRRCAPPGQSTPSPGPTTPGVGATPRPDPPGRDRLVWGDEFDSATVDTSKWNVRDNAYAANEASCQFASQVSQGHGVLSIRVDKGSYTCGSRTSHYASGYVDSIDRSPPVGVGSRFVWRAKMPIIRRASQGYWPALWLRSNQAGSSYPAGEIDAVEVWGAFRPDIVDSDHASVHTVHENTEGVGARSTSVHRFGSRTPGDGFHTYAVDLLTDQIQFRVDGALVHTVSTATDAWLAPLLAPGVTWNVRMNVQICNPRTWCSAPNAKTRFGQSMDIDYVRVYG